MMANLSDYQLVQTCSSMEAVDKYLKSLQYHYKKVCETKTKTVYRCSYEARETKNQCEACLYVYQTEKNILIYKSKYQPRRHSHPFPKEVPENYKIKKSYTFIKTFPSLETAENHMQTLDEWSVILDGTNHIGKRIVYQCKLKQSSGKMCQARVRYLFCSDDTIRFEKSVVDHSHSSYIATPNSDYSETSDLIIEPQSVTCSNQESVEKHKLKIIRKDLPDSHNEQLCQNEKKHTEIDSREVFINPKIVLEQISRFWAPYWKLNPGRDELTINCNYMSPNSRNCEAQMFLIKSGKTNVIYLLVNTLEHIHDSPEVVYWKEKHKSDFLSKVDDFISGSTINYRKNSSKHLFYIFQLYEMGFNLLTSYNICKSSLIKSDDLCTSTTFITLYNECMEFSNTHTKRQKYWTRISPKSSKHEIYEFNKSKMALPEYIRYNCSIFNTIAEVEDFLQNENKWMYITGEKLDSTFKHVFQCTDKLSIHQLTLNFDGIQRKIFKHESKISTVNNLNKYDNSSDVWNFFKTFNNRKTMDTFIHDNQWRLMFLDPDYDGHTYFYKCSKNNTCRARIKVHMRSNNKITVYKTHMHEHYTQRKTIITAADKEQFYNETEKTIQELYNFGFDANAIKNYIQNNNLPLPDKRRVRNYINTAITQLKNVDLQKYQLRIKDKKEIVCKCQPQIHASWLNENTFDNISSVELYLENENTWIYDHFINSNYGFQHHFKCQLSTDYVKKCPALLNILFNGSKRKIQILKYADHNHSLGNSSSNKNTNFVIEKGSNSKEIITSEKSIEATSSTECIESVVSEISRYDRLPPPPPLIKISNLKNNPKLMPLIRVSNMKSVSELESPKTEFTSALNPDNWIPIKRCKNKFEIDEFMEKSNMVYSCVKRSTNARILFYRCNLVPEKGPQCDVIMKLVYSTQEKQIIVLKLNVQHTHENILFLLESSALHSKIETFYKLGFNENYIVNRINSTENIANKVDKTYVTDVIRSLNIEHYKIKFFTNNDNVAQIRNLNRRYKKYSNISWIFIRKFNDAIETYDYLDYESFWIFGLKEINDDQIQYFYDCNHANDDNIQCNCSLVFVSNASTREIIMYRSKLYHEHYIYNKPYTKEGLYSTSTDILQQESENYIYDLYVLGFEPKFIYSYLRRSGSYRLTPSDVKTYISAIQSNCNKLQVLNNYCKRVIPVEAQEPQLHNPNEEWNTEYVFYNIGATEHFINKQNIWCFDKSLSSKNELEHHYRCIYSSESNCQASIVLQFNPNLKNITLYTSFTQHNHHIYVSTFKCIEGISRRKRRKGKSSEAQPIFETSEIIIDTSDDDAFNYQINKIKRNLEMNQSNIENEMSDPKLLVLSECNETIEYDIANNIHDDIVIKEEIITENNVTSNHENLEFNEETSDTEMLNNELCDNITKNQDYSIYSDHNYSVTPEKLKLIELCQTEQQIQCEIKQEQIDESPNNIENITCSNEMQVTIKQEPEDIVETAGEGTSTSDLISNVIIKTEPEFSYY